MLEIEIGALSLRTVDGWERKPAHIQHLDVAGVSTDSHDNVYVLGRLDSRVTVYDRAGTYLRDWGYGSLSVRPHSIVIGPDDTALVVDETKQQIGRYTLAGEPLGTIGSGERSDTGYSPEGGMFDRLNSITHSAGPFNFPTGVAVGPHGDLYVTDGYGNARVHRFDSNGTLLGSWGEPGVDAGQFRLPHHIIIDSRGALLVADRENERVQVFDLDGELQATWDGVQRPTGLAMLANGNVLVAHLGWVAGEVTSSGDTIGTRVPAALSLYTPDGVTISRWVETGDGSGPGAVLAPHAIAVDSHDSIYVGDVPHSFMKRRGTFRSDFNTLQKFEIQPQ